MLTQKHTQTHDKTPTRRVTPPTHPHETTPRRHHANDKIRHKRRSLAWRGLPMDAPLPPTTPAAIPTA